LNVYCPKCEAANPEDAELCSMCGYRLGPDKEGGNDRRDALAQAAHECRAIGPGKATHVVRDRWNPRRFLVVVGLVAVLVLLVLVSPWIRKADQRAITPSTTVQQLINSRYAQVAGNRQYPAEPVERYSALNVRVAETLSDEQRKAWCDWTVEWYGRELDRDSDAEGRAAITWTILHRNAIVNGESIGNWPPDIPKWNIPKWEHPAYAPGSGPTIDIRDKFRAAWRSMFRVGSKSADDARFRDPILMSPPEAVRVAEVLGPDKEAWLRWGLDWAYSECRPGLGDGLLCRNYFGIIYNLTDDEELAQSALSQWKEISHTRRRRKGAAPATLTIPLWTVWVKNNGDRSLSTGGGCWDPKTVREYNEKISDDRWRLVKKTFRDIAECWCEQDVVDVIYYKPWARRGIQRGGE